MKYVEEIHFTFSLDSHKAVGTFCSCGSEFCSLGPIPVLKFVF